MARNMITGKETQKMQEYTQEQIDRAEHMGIEIPADVKEQIFEYANLIGEEEKVRTLVRNLTDAINQADEDKVEELLDDAKMDIQDLPDPTIGKLELRDYGYTAEDMVPLRKEAALDYHRMGSKIYCLDSDGGKGEYASKEMIQTHEGLFGMELQMWERIRDQDLDYADEDVGAFQEPMSVIDQEEALKLYDAGADIYLITNFSSPVYVTERKEIERGPEHYQMSMAERERFRNLEWEMQKYPQIQSLKEANLLLGTRRTFGIYQIKDDSPGENYAFMNMSFIESHSMQIKKEDYKLVYVGELLGNTSLDDIFERFNIDRPKDFRGHSLSVSDIVVLNDGEKVTAHFVDSISFERLDSFLNLEEQVLSELAYEVGERYFAIQRTEEGYDYSFYDEDFRLMDGGVYENGEISIEEAAEELLKDEGWTGERIRGDYDQLMEKVEEMDEVVMAEIQKSQGEYKPLAKVEELEEANYNMIDNVLNNMPPKKEPYLEYFATECDEFHDMGAYEKSTDVNQIAAVYKKYRENPETAYLGCSMGIIYRDPEDSYYDEAEFAIVKGNTVFGNLMDDVRFYGELALVREGIEKIHEALPDYKYVPMGYAVEKDKDYAEKLLQKNIGALKEMCKAEDVTSLYFLGFNLIYGIGMDENDEEAVQLLEVGSYKGDSSCTILLAECYLNGWGVAENKEKAFRMLNDVKKLNKKGNFLLGRCYYHGIGTEQDFVKAVECFKKAANLNHGTAKDYLGDCYYNGQGIDQSYSEAAKWYKDAADNNKNGSSAHSLAFMYLKGEGLPEDIHKAIDYWHIAADKGITQAQRIISREYISGEYLEKDYIKAKKYIEMAAEKGDAEAQFTLGRYYISEMGFDNEQKCFEWFQKAAEQGLVEAEYAVGGCYENELGVKQDYAQANYWYQIAVKDGHKRAAYDLGINYLKGQGIEKDVEAGIQLLEIASNGNVHEACRELATRYHYGIPNFRGQALYKNPSEAQRLASIAVQDESDGKAQYILAKIIEEDFGNSQAAIEWYRKAVLNENKEAMLGLSRIYINTQSNCQEAVQMLSKLISEKNGEAQYLYAQCLENGYGCTKDKREAKKYYQLAQSNGYEGAKRKKRFGFF